MEHSSLKKELWLAEETRGRAKKKGFDGREGADVDHTRAKGDDDPGYRNLDGTKIAINIRTEKSFPLNKSPRAPDDIRMMR